MSIQFLIKRFIAAYLIAFTSIVLFYFVVDFLTKEQNLSYNITDDFSLQITYAFSAFSFIGVSFTNYFLYREFSRKKHFFNEIKRFSKKVLEGNLKDKIFYKDSSDYDEVYYLLNNIYDDLKDKFIETEEESSRLNAILENIPDALIILDNRNEIIYANDKAHALFTNKKSNNIFGKPLIEVIRSAELIEALETVTRFDKSEVCDLFFDPPDEKYLQVRISPYYRQNDIVGLVVLFHDITELKKLEAMRKDFVANVTHEIKTPVTAITGFAETLIDGAIEDKDNAIRFLKTIHFHGERLNRLVDDLMTISKIEMGVTKLNISQVELSSLIDHAVVMLTAKAKHKGLTIKKSLPDTPLWIEADRDKLIQILLNIIDNAIKFTQNGYIEIGIVRNKDSDCLYVKDTGSGVPKRYLSRLGERFFRVDASRSRELGGTGLGLAIVKHIIKAHNWGFKIESEESQGTKVNIIIYK
ncbi:alkaline phosphatase synthesis sensor protein PhoR [Candidatus Magnetoovum chiemensis]|nr:alkaline phosphatase synthesis sensor protein PhoR [Candidatus Magnetoovum chiemensis]